MGWAKCASDGLDEKSEPPPAPSFRRRNAVKILAILLWGGMGVVAQTQGDREARLSTVDVYVRLGFSDPNLRLPCAENVASALFDKIGVHIQWRMGAPKPNSGTLPIVIDITSDTPLTFHPGALAYAREFEGEHIQIFWDRVKTTADDRLVTNLLAHVMVHEITHLLQGTNHHSPAGIMKARWTDQELARLNYRPLSFDRRDVEMIHNGLARRGSRSKSAAYPEEFLRTGVKPRTTVLAQSSPATPRPALPPGWPPRP